MSQAIPLTKQKRGSQFASWKVPYYRLAPAHHQCCRSTDPHVPLNLGGKNSTRYQLNLLPLYRFSTDPRLRWDALNREDSAVKHHQCQRSGTVELGRRTYISAHRVSVKPGRLSMGKHEEGSKEVLGNCRRVFCCVDPFVFGRLHNLLPNHRHLYTRCYLRGIHGRHSTRHNAESWMKLALSHQGVIDGKPSTRDS